MDLAKLTFEELQPLIEQAQREDSQRKEFAFLANHIEVCGIALKLISLRQFLLLSNLDSPFLCGGERTTEDYAVFLWLLSTDYTPGKESLRAFSERIAFLSPCALDVEIGDYLDLMFSEMPPASRSGGKAGASRFGDHVIHLLASNYGWDDNVILDKPLMRLFKYIEQITSSRTRPQFSGKREKIIGEWLRAQNQKTTENPLHEVPTDLREFIESLPVTVVTQKGILE